LSGKTITLYRFKTNDDGITDYYDEKGQSVRKSLMRTPIDGARLTSGFGKRKHPVLGYTKMHRGVDFGARTGTPIMAAGNGVVEFAARNGGYGNYVRIRHNNSYKTAYAHMSKYGKGIRKGTQVKQGQIIGYVGTTGRSTGPHLHYEVHKNGTQINPLSVKLPAGRKLEGKMLTAFNATKENIRREVAGVELETQLLAKLKD
jgi:murein DD-endopeptidase MepM/ murein hydrolase activator NlpD